MDQVFLERDAVGVGGEIGAEVDHFAAALLGRHVQRGTDQRGLGDVACGAGLVAALAAGENQGLLWLVALALFGSLLSLYYYLAVLKVIFVDAAATPGRDS